MATITGIKKEKILKVLGRKRLMLELNREDLELIEECEEYRIYRLPFRLRGCVYLKETKILNSGYGYALGRLIFRHRFMEFDIKHRFLVQNITENIILEDWR